MTERAGVLALAALAPAAMLAVDPAGWYPFGPVKWFAVSVLVLSGAALVLRDRAVRLPPPLGVALLVFLGWLVLAAAVGEDGLYAWIGTPERHFGVLTWGLCALALVVGCSIDVDRDRHWLLGGLLLAGIGVGAVATAEALGWEPAVLDVGQRLTGSFGSSAYLGAATALLLPVAAALALARTTSPGQRAAAAVAVALLTIAAVGSGARAAWVGLTAALVAVIWARRHGLAERARARRGGAAAAGVAAAVVVIAVLVLTPAGGRLGALTDEDAAGGQGRIDEWRVAARIALDHPVTGVGPEGYRIAFADGVDADYERSRGRELQPDRAHSGPLDVLLSGGVVALLAWGVVVVLVGRAVLRALRAGEPWLVGLGAGLIAHQVGQVLLFPVMELEPLAWLLGGVVVGASSTDRSPPIRTRARAAVVGMLSVAALVALAAGVTDVVADRRADRAADALARGDGRAAATAAADAVNLRPDVVRLHLLAARAVVTNQQGTVAGLREVDAALDVSPGDPIVLLARAQLLVDRAVATRVDAHREQALVEVERLLADDPVRARLWRLRAVLAQLAGDDDGARVATDRAEDLDPTEPDR